MKKYLLKTFNGSEYLDSELSLTFNKNKVELEYDANGLNFRAEDEYPFLALIKIRIELEKLSLKILCNGSRVDVYPSGGSLISLKAYELKVGEQATKLLNIFEPEDDVEKIATIKDQKLYRDRWLESFK